MHRAMDIAKCIITYYSLYGTPISNLRLQYMLYIVWIRYYKDTCKNLFSNTSYDWFLCYKFGPCVQEVYNEFTAYGGMPINRIYDNSNLSVEKIGLIDTYLSEYSGYTLKDLSDYICRDSGAWRYCYDMAKEFYTPMHNSIILEKEVKGVSTIRRSCNLIDTRKNKNKSAAIHKAKIRRVSSEEFELLRMIKSGAGLKPIYKDCLYSSGYRLESYPYISKGRKETQDELITKYSLLRRK